MFEDSVHRELSFDSSGIIDDYLFASPQSEISVQIEVSSDARLKDG